jgi:hypothetical protein
MIPAFEGSWTTYEPVRIMRAGHEIKPQHLHTHVSCGNWNSAIYIYAESNRNIYYHKHTT